MRIKKFTKPQIAAFLKALKVKEGDVIETRFGRLDIGLIEAHADMFTVYSRFSDPSRLTAHGAPSNSNPYSGKWNHHYTRGGYEGGEICAFLINEQIDKITLQPDEPKTQQEVIKILAEALYNLQLDMNDVGDDIDPTTDEPYVANAGAVEALYKTRSYHDFKVNQPETVS